MLYTNTGTGMCEGKLLGLQLELDLGFETLEETCADCGKTAFPCWKRSLRSVPTRRETVRPRNMPEEKDHGAVSKPALQSSKYTG